MQENKNNLREQQDKYLLRKLLFKNNAANFNNFNNLKENKYMKVYQIIQQLSLIADISLLLKFVPEKGLIHQKLLINFQHRILNPLKGQILHSQITR